MIHRWRCFTKEKLFIHSFIHSFVRSFVRSFIHSFIHSIRSLIPYFLRWFVRSFLRSCIYSFISRGFRRLMGMEGWLSKTKSWNPATPHLWWSCGTFSELCTLPDTLTFFMKSCNKTVISIEKRRQRAPLRNANLSKNDPPPNAAIVLWTNCLDQPVNAHSKPKPVNKTGEQNRWGKWNQTLLPRARRIRGRCFLAQDCCTKLLASAHPVLEMTSKLNFLLPLHFAAFENYRANNLYPTAKREIRR